MKALVPLALVLAVLGPAAALSAQGVAPADRRQAYLDLTTSLRLLCVAPHPGDEDGAVLAACRKGRGVRTAIAFVTSGEGGRSAVGPELGDALRVVRMNECEAAARVLGARAYYLHLPDFGFTSRREETLARWGEERTRERLVRVIRRVRPHVVIVSSPGTAEVPGHQQAVFKVLKDAIRDAADVTRFDDQLQELLYPWRVRRLFVRSERDRATAAVDVARRDPVLGVTYAEIGERSLACHRSQGRRPRPAAELPGTVYYRRVVPPPDPAGPRTADLFDGLVGYDQEELELNKEADFHRARAVEQKIREAGTRLLALAPDDPQVKTRLVETLRALRELSERPFATRVLARGEWFDEKGYQDFFRRRAADLSNAVRQGLKIGVSLRVDRRPRAADERFPVDVKVTTAAAGPIENLGVRLENSASFAKTYVEQRSRRLTRERPVFAYFKAKVLPGAALTEPKAVAYRTVGRFEPGLRCVIRGRIDGELFAFVLGVPAPPVVAPVRIRPRPARLLCRLGTAGKDGIPVEVDFVTQGPLYVLGGRPEEGPLRFRLEAAPPAGVAVKPPSIVVENRRSGETSRHRFRFFPDRAVTGASITFRARLLRKDGSAGPGGPACTAGVPVDVLDCRVSDAARAVVVAGRDPALVGGLKALGVAVEVVDGGLDRVPLDVVAGKRPPTLLVDGPGPGARPAPGSLAPKILAFVERGGVVVFLGPPREAGSPEAGRFPLAPFPLRFGRGRVSDENAPVEILEPAHPLLAAPNAIGPDAFRGWVVERGHGFPSEADPHYVRLLALHADDGRRLDTGLLVAKRGRGAVVFTALALDRQLGAGVPGAFALLANLVSYRPARGP